MQQPTIVINWAAIGAAVLATVVLGGVWYGPLFGKTWARLMKLPDDFKPERRVIVRAVVLTVVGALLTAYVLAHSVQVWRPTSWNGAWSDAEPALYGFFAGFFTWLGFYVPQLLGTVAWEGRPWKLFAINATHAFIALQAAGMILAFWR